MKKLISLLLAILIVFSSCLITNNVLAEETDPASTDEVTEVYDESDGEGDEITNDDEIIDDTSEDENTSQDDESDDNQSDDDLLIDDESDDSIDDDSQEEILEEEQIELDDSFYIDPEIAYPEPEDGTEIEVYHFYDNDNYVAYKTNRNEFYEGLDTTPKAEAWVDSDVLLDYAEHVDQLQSDDDITIESLWEEITGESVTVNATPLASSLPTPVNARWNNGEALFDLPTTVNMSNVSIDLKIYKDNQFWKGISYLWEGYFSGTIELSASDFDYVTGNYYFTVQLISEISSVASSGIARSGVFSYTAPSTKLSIPQNVYRERSNGNVIAHWDSVKNAGGYQVEWRTIDNSFIGWTTIRDGSATQDYFGFLTPDRRGFKFSGDLGKLVIRIRALSDNIIQRRHSDYSSWQTKRTGSFSYYSMLADVLRTYTYTYNDGFFNKSSYDVDLNMDLVRMSIRMAMSASQTESSGIENLMRGLGFEYMTKYSDYPKPKADTIGYAIGKKAVKLDNGDSFTLIAVAVRGGGYGTEWASNFTLGSYQTHKGFHDAGTKILDSVKRLIEKEVNGDVKIWISGFSRGAAVANIAAYYLTLGAKNNGIGKLRPKNIYAFCFECPAVTREAAAADSNFFNIKNFVNELDIVPQVAPSMWGYRRYGKDYNIPSSSTTKNYSSAFNKMKTNYIKIASKAVHNPQQKVAEVTKTTHNQAAFVKQIVKTMANHLSYYDFVAAPYYYTRDHQDDMRILGVAIGTDTGDKLVNIGGILAAFVNAVPLYAGAHLPIVSQIIVSNKLLGYPHYPELCLAWMETVASETDFVDSKTRNLKVNCPVDVTVRDSEGTIVAMIVNDEPIEIEDSFIGTYIDENGQKIISLPMDEEYSIEFNARDDGEMSVQVEEYDVNSGETYRLVNYYDIPITEGDVLHAEAEQLNGDSCEYTVTDTENIVIDSDSDLTGEEIKSYAINMDIQGEGYASGSGTYLVGEYVRINTQAEDGWSFMGLYEDGTLISNEEGFRFRVEEDRNLTVVFRKDASDIVLNREYLAMEVGGESQQIVAECIPTEWQEYLKWRVENADGENGTIISITEDGNVTAISPGSAYAVAYLDYEGQTISSRCRIDVAGENGVPKSVSSSVESASVFEDNVKLNIFSTDYSQFSVILAMPQNYSHSLTNNNPTNLDNNGAAIKAAYLTDALADSAYRLQVVDDRNIRLIPRQELIDGTLKVQKSYKSNVLIELEDGTYVTTENAVNISTDTKKPTVKISKPITFNSFEKENIQQLIFNTNDIISVRIDETSNGNAEWLTLNAEEHTLKLKPDVTGNKSGKLNLLVKVDGCAVELPVVVNVKAQEIKPALKLSASTITLQNDINNSLGVPLSIVSTKKDVNLSDLQISDVQIQGFVAEDFNSETGEFVLKCTETPVAGKKNVVVSFDNSNSTIALPLTVKVQSVEPVLSKKKISLIAWSFDRAIIQLSAKPADYRIENPIISLTNPKGTITYAQGTPDEDGYLINEHLRIRYVDGEVFISSPIVKFDEEGNCIDPLGYAYPYESAYKLHVKFDEQGKESIADINIVSNNNLKAKMNAKVSGKIDLAYPGSAALVNYSFQNVNSECSGSNYIYIEGRKGKNVVEFDATEKFNISSKNNGYSISVVNEKDIDTSLVYYACLEQQVTEWASIKTEVKLPISTTAITLKPSASKVLLNVDKNDSARIKLAPSKKDYPLNNVVIDITDMYGSENAADQLDILMDNDVLHIKVNENTLAGNTYNLSIRAAEKCKATNMTVNITETGTPIGASIKVAGKLDIIRPNTGITITPSYVGCSGYGDYNKNAEVLIDNIDVSDKFIIFENENGTFNLRLKKGEYIDWNKKSICKTRLVLNNGEAYSNYVNLSVTMNNASVKMDKTELVLSSIDRFSSTTFVIESKDKSLSEISRVEFVDNTLNDLYRIVNLGGNRFEIGFKDNRGSVQRVDKNVKLNVWFEGNGSSTFNCTVTFKIVVK